MTKEKFLNICERVDNGESVCVERDDGKKGKVVGCLLGGEAFRIEIKGEEPPELWHRKEVEREVSCNE